jgi:endonuclease YncB( thermonuclease family)
MLSLAPVAFAADLIGQASIIDGDTIEIHGQRIRILDIDAPEGRQTCTKPDGTEWRCGQQAALALADWIGQGTVTCASDSRNNYGLLLARCVVAGEDVANWLAA